MQRYFIRSFGCAANTADAERIAGAYQSRGWRAAPSMATADEVVLVTCMIRQSAEDRVTGVVRNLGLAKAKGRKVKVIVTGCMTGMGVRDKSGKLLASFKRRLPAVDEFMAVEEVGFSYPQLRQQGTNALVVISNGCNNYCSYCVVPYARGAEASRPFDDIIAECRSVVAGGYTHVTLVGQNVNSYGADIVAAARKNGLPVSVGGKLVEPVMVKHLGKTRIPTLFPYLLAAVCAVDGITSVDFISSNPWDFSDELIRVIADNPKVSRAIHLPVQSGDGEMLKRMNRWYTPEEYLALIQKIRAAVSGVTFSTDIIVGFCGETEDQFRNTVALCKKVGFTKAYISMYSDRQGTVAHKGMVDDVPFAVKKRRWNELDARINKANLKNGTYR